MDMKIFLALLATGLIAIAGIAYAVPGMQLWLNGMGEMRPNGTDGNNSSAFNSTAFQQFQSAVESGDYQGAKSLHGQYGFGGKLFGRLNESTFADYSSVFQLRRELFNATLKLRGELGMNGTAPMMGMGQFMKGFQMGMREGKQKDGN
jgi:hypothetical protein